MLVLRSGENQSTRRKTSRSKEITSNKLNSYMTPGPRIEPLHHPYTTPTPPLHHHYTTPAPPHVILATNLILATNSEKKINKDDLE